MKFIINKSYYSPNLKDSTLKGKLFTILYKSGSKITISDGYDDKNVLICTLESTPNTEIITLPSGENIWRNLCQEKLDNYKFEALNLPKYENFEF